MNKTPFNTEDGKPLVRYKDGQQFLYNYDLNTVTSSPYHWLNGRYTGEFKTEVLEDRDGMKKGDLVMMQSFVPGSKTEAVFALYQNGIIHLTRRVVFDPKAGTSTDYDGDQIATISQRDPRTNAVTGVTSFYSGTDKPIHQHPYKDNMAHGTAYTYNEQGLEIGQATFKNGEMLSTNYYNKPRQPHNKL